jgi:hypothetical protein
LEISYENVKMRLIREEGNCQPADVKSFHLPQMGWKE